MRFYTRWCDFCGKTLDAYGVGVGAWDVQQVRYAYSEFAPGADATQVAFELAALLDG